VNAYNDLFCHFGHHTIPLHGGIVFDKYGRKQFSGLYLKIIKKQIIKVSKF